MFIIYLTGFISFSATSQGLYNITINRATACEGVNTYFTFEDAGNSDSIHWTFDGILMDSIHTITETIRPGRGSHLVTATVFYGQDSIGKHSQIVDAYGFPTEFWPKDGSQFCPGEEVVFRINPMDMSFSWVIEGSYYYDEVVPYVFPEEGTYTISLMGTSSCSSMDTIQQTITISKNATAHTRPLIKSEGWHCPHDKVFFGYEGHLQNEVWNFGDGSTVTGVENPGHIYKTPGIYKVTLTADNLCGASDTDTAIVIINENSPANADFAYTPEKFEFCPLEHIKFYAKGSGKYLWDFNDGGTSNEAFPIHVFPDTNNNFYVQLTVSNSCGNSNTSMQPITIYDLASMGNGVTPFFDMPGFDEQQSTYRICQPESIKLSAYMDVVEDIDFEWEITSGANVTTILKGKSVEFDFTYDSYVIQLNATDLCGFPMEASELYVDTSSSLRPTSLPGVFPLRLCTNEPVYFWDDAISSEVDTLPYTYAIDYGDGTSETDIRTFEDKKNGIIRSYSYGVSDNYTYAISAVNDCGVSTSVPTSGTIQVLENAPVEVMIHNSTGTWDEDAKIQKYIQDWSQRNDVTDKVLQVKTSISMNVTDNNSYYYLIYEGYADDPPYRMPDAFVKKEVSPGFTGIDTIEIFVPDYVYDIGIVAGWYCDSLEELMYLPDVMQLPIDTNTSIVYSIPVYQPVENYVDSLNTVLSSIPCTTQNPDHLYGLWRYTGLGYYIFANIYQDKWGYDLYDVYISDNLTGVEKKFVSSGEYTIDDTLFYLYDYIPMCTGMSTASYYYIINGDTLSFINYGEECPERLDTLENKNFVRIPRNYPEYAACPYDTVRFEIYGGTSYYWTFGDGGHSTDPNASHVYKTPGIYHVSCDVTNGCSITETFYTDVIVSEGVLPLVEFETDNWFPKEDEKVKFRYKNSYEDQRFKDYIFDWDFGDGKSSALINPTHIFTNPGIYNVKLSITNKCGTAVSPSQPITIKKECDVYPRYKMAPDTSNPNIMVFYNNSFGDIHNKELWKFDDEPIEVRKVNLISHYFTDGMHTACLLVFKSDSSCSDMICKDFVVGTVNCQADFTYDVNSTTNEVFFVNNSLNTTEYYWDFGDGTSSTSENPAKTYRQAGYYLVTLTATNNNSCSSIREEWIQVGDEITDCVADFWHNIDEADSTLVHFQNNSTTQGKIFRGYYDFGDGLYSFDDPNPSHQYEEPGIYTVCAGFVDDNGCQSRVCKAVNVGNLDCYADFHVIHSRDNTSAIYIADSIEDAEYFWDFGDGATSEGRIVTHFYKEPGSYSVCLNVVNASQNCFVEMCKKIAITGDASIEVCNVNYSFIIDKSTNTVSFSGRSGTPFTNWFWDFGDGGVSDAKDTTHQYAEDGVYKVCLYAYDEETGCFDEECKAVVITNSNTGEQLTADFTAINQRETLKVKYYNRSKGEYTNKYWTFGDGDFDLGLLGDTVSHVFPKAGIWKSCLSVVNSSTFNANRTCKRIFVGDATECSLSANFSMIVIQENLQVNFFDRSTGGAYRWFWNFGDGNSSTLRKPSHTYRKEGLYLVTLSAQDTTGNCIDHIAKFVQVGQSDCRARFEFSINSATNGIRFKNTSSGNITEYLWDFGDGTTSTDQNPIHIFAPGSYNVSLTVSSDAGCVDEYFERIQVGLIPCDADFTAHVDETNKAYFNNNVLGNINKLMWIFGDGAISERNDPIHQYKNAGIYTVGLYAYTGTCMDYSEQTIIVGERDGDMQAFFTQTVDEDTRTVKFFDRSIGTDENTTYIWDFGDATTSTEQNPVKTFSEGGYYFVCFTVIGQNGMQNTTCKMVKVAPANSKDCLADFFYTVDSATLTGEFTSISWGTNATTNYKWIFGDEVIDGMGKEVSYVFDSSGFYNVGLRITNPVSQCKSAEYKLINVGKGDQGIKASFVYMVDSSSLKAGGYPVDFVGTASPPKPAKFTWDFGDKKKSSGLTTTSRVTHIYAETGTYIVCYTVEDPQTGETDEYCQVTVVDPTNIQNLQSSLSLFDNYPNPFNEYTRILFTTSEKMYIELTVLDNTGREITTLIKTSKNAGSHEYLWDTSELAEGVYYLRLSTSKGQIRTRMTVKK